MDSLKGMGGFNLPLSRTAVSAVNLRENRRDACSTDWATEVTPTPKSVSMKVAFTTLGCKANQYDTDVMAQVCRAAGFEIVTFEDGADAYVINTCAVTSAAVVQTRNLIRMVVRKNPEAAVVVCGCSSQIDPDSFKAIDGVDHVMGVRAADEVVNILNNLKSPPTPLYKRGERGDLASQGCHPEPLRLRSGQAPAKDPKIQSSALKNAEF